MIYVVNVYGDVKGVFSTRELAEQYVVTNYVVKNQAKIPFIEEFKLDQGG